MAEDRMLSDEVLLALIKKNSGGGGGGGTDNYNDLKNKPQIAGTILSGNKSLADLGIASATALGTVSDAVTAITDGQTIDSFSDVETALADKVDVVDGKGLSTNDYTDTDKAIVDGVTAALTGKQDALTAGLYIEIDNNEISVKRDITQTAQQIEYNFTIPSDFTLRVKKYLNGDLVNTTDYTWNSVTDPINLDSIMEVSKKAGNYWVVKNLIASTTQAADYSQDLYAMQQATDYTQNFVATIDADKKLIIQSELDTALASKVNTSAVGVAGGVAGLGNDGKVPASQLPAQKELTAGQYIDITNDAISVQRDIARDVDAIIATSFDFPNCTVTKTIDEEVVDTVTFSMFGDIPSSVMGVYSVNYNGQAVALTFTNLVASKEHSIGYAFTVASYSSGVIDTQTFVETVDADKKLIIQSELDTALADKVDKVTGKGLSKNDYTDADKAKVAASLNVFTGTQAEWAALSTAEKKTYQRADFTDDYDNTAIGDLTALHTSAKSSIVNAINEVADGKQNSTDNNLQTTSKTIVGGINEVKSGLTGLEHDRFIKAYRGNIDGTGSINVQLAGSRLYQYYVYRDDPSYVGFGMIDTNYANTIHTNPIITTNLVTFTDSGNGVLTIANGSEYAVGILIVDISASFT